MDKFAQFLSIIDVLLGENGCPWDRAQTHETLRNNLIEEAYETAEAIDGTDMPALCQELGDALMCIALHARVAERAGAFTLDDLLEGISQKLIRRHSHIFGEDKAATAGEVEALWQANKNKEKPGLPPASALRSVPKTMPALMRAEKVLHRDGTGTDTAACCARAQKLLAELMDAAISSTETRSGTPMDALMGEILFLLAEISDILQINAEISLTNKIEAFINSKD